MVPIREVKRVKMEMAKKAKTRSPVKVADNERILMELI